MKKYIYDSEEYSSLWEIRNRAKNLVFPDDIDSDLLKAVGIDIIEVEDVSDDENSEAIKQRKKYELLNNLTVEVDGMIFDANEISQRRMSNAIVGWDDNKKTITWILANNTSVDITKVQLSKALQLAVSKMTEIWTNEDA